MIRHDYECENGHVTEHIVKAEKARRPRKCTIKGCGLRAELAYLPRHQRNANAPATVVFQKKLKNGEIKTLYPWRSDDRPPKGFERVELVGATAVRRFAKEQNEKERREALEVEYYEHERLRAEQKVHHSDLRSEMSQMDDFHRSLAREAIREADKQGVNTNYDPNFHVRAWE